MTTAKQTFGRNIDLAKIVEPKEIFLGQGPQTKTLYALEEQRSKLLESIAMEWGKINKVDGGFRDVLWNQLMPQVLFDTLEAYSPSVAIVAAEAFLKQFGWKIERPNAP